MSVHPVTLGLSKNIYICLRKRAGNSRRTVEMVLLDVVDAALSACNVCF